MNRMQGHEANPQDSPVTQFARNYFQDESMIGNPYLYGHLPEVTVHPNGNTKAVKHYSMGRTFLENVKVAPIIHSGDDGAYTIA